MPISLNVNPHNKLICYRQNGILHVAWLPQEADDMLPGYRAHVHATLPASQPTQSTDLKINQLYFGTYKISVIVNDFYLTLLSV